MINEILQKRLKLLDFSNKEAMFYLNLLKSGPSKISDLAKNLPISREMCYSIAKNLIKRGVIEITLEKYNRKFVAKHPSVLQEIIKKEKEKIIAKENVVNSIFNDLNSLYSTEEKHVKVEYLPGINGIKEMYNKSLSSKEEILSFTSSREVENILGDFANQYFNKRVKNKVKIKTIIPYYEVAVKYKKEEKEFLRDVAIISNEYDFTTELYIYDNIVSISSFKEMFAVIIESDEIAQTFKKIYKLAWQDAKSEKFTKFNTNI